MTHRSRYDSASKGFRGSKSKDEVMPAPRNRLVVDGSLINGAPFGPFDPNKPFWQADRKKNHKKGF